MKCVANILNFNHMMEWQQKNVEEMTCSLRWDLCGLSSSSGSSVFSGDSLGSSAAVTGTGSSSFVIASSTSTLLSSVFSSSFSLPFPSKSWSLLKKHNFGRTLVHHCYHLDRPLWWWWQFHPWWWDQVPSVSPKLPSSFSVSALLFWRSSLRESDHHPQLVQN